MPLPPVTHTIGTPFIELQSVDSTNNYALAQIHANRSQAGTAYFASEQTAGRGQRGKSWATEKGANIIVSIVLNPGFLQPFQQFSLSACIAVATHHFMRHYAGDELTIKWPNDLYWKDRKLGGILIENILGGTNFEPSDIIPGQKQNPPPSSANSTWKWSVVGIGLNINQTTFPSSLKNPVSLKQITGQHFDVLQMARALCLSIDYFYKECERSGAAGIITEYNQALYKKNELARLKKGSRIFEATIQGVSESGKLLTQHAITEQFEHGEVEWIG